MKFIITVLIWLCWPVSTAWAWDFAVHFVIAQRAYDELSQAQQLEVRRLSALLAQAEPAVSDFVPASVWLDAQNWSGFGLMQHWHYQPRPWLQGPYVLPEQASDHALWILAQARKTLRNPQATDFQQALMLRVMAHVSADIHQPLHAIERFCAAHPTGDRGGSALAIQHSDYRHLHALWDAAGGQYPYLRLSDWPRVAPQVKVWADHLGKAYPCSDIASDPEVWAAEAYDLGRTAYQMPAGQSLPPAYLQKVQQISSRQMARAACRLADELQFML
ncbi:MAG: S1/P1 nuclease [Candidatus Sericytochromatia bacterium]|nr:S1/P1 nuclease [Candidatus Sericytochromatia bacterium]